MALEADPLWAKELRVVDHEGLSYFQWSDDPLLVDVDRSSPLRPLGRGETLALTDDVAIRTADPVDIELVLNTSIGVHPSLMDDPGFGAVAAEFERRDVCYAELIPPDNDHRDWFPLGVDLETRNRVLQLPLLVRPLMFGRGYSVDADGAPLAILLYAMETAAEAELAIQAISAVYVSEMSGAGAIREASVLGDVASVVVELDLSPEGIGVWRTRQYLLFRTEPPDGAE